MVDIYYDKKVILERITPFKTRLKSQYYDKMVNLLKGDSFVIHKGYIMTIYEFIKTNKLDVKNVDMSFIDYEFNEIVIVYGSAIDLTAIKLYL